MMELAHYEAALNGNVNEFPFCDIHRQDLSDIFNKMSGSGNSLLHVAASSGHVEITELMACQYPHLITKKNIEEDTPLHVAVRAAKLDTAKILVSTTSEANEASLSLLKMENNKGNTALHEALLALQALDESSNKESLESLVSLARYLVSSDPSVYYNKNNAIKTPLHLAVESGNNDILDYLLCSLPVDDDSNNFKGPSGKSPVHIAVEQRKLEALEIIKEKNPELLLLRDENGNTPLHYAASEGYLEGVRCLSKINISDGVLARNEKGLYPIHLACESGHSEAMMELLRMWPHPEDLLTDKGQNILHIAAKTGKRNTVRCICQEYDIDKLLNKMDKDGNTPLHLAALGQHAWVLNALVNNSRSKLDLMNNQGLTAYDIAVEQFEMKDMVEVSGKQILLVGNERPVDAKIVYDESLKASKLKRSKNPKRRKALMTLAIIHIAYSFDKKRFNRPIKAAGLERAVGREENEKRINNLLVVATLIIGASFAAGIQMATTSSTSYHNKIKWTSKAFVILNTLAMNMSVLAALMLCYAQLAAAKVAYGVVLTVYGIVGFSIYMLCLAFWCALYSGTQRHVLPSIALGILFVIFVFMQSYFLHPTPLFSLLKHANFLVWYHAVLRHFAGLLSRSVKRPTSALAGLLVPYSRSADT